jgi:hypothetical protein
MHIEADDLKVGMIITVLKGAEIKTQESSGAWSLGTKTVTRESEQCKGEVLRVEAIDLPYVVVSRIEYSSKIFGKISFDVRETKFMELSNDYIESKLDRK